MDENKPVIDGVQYEAVVGTDDCIGCAAFTLTDDESLCRSMPHCIGLSRKDGRDVIYIRATSPG